MRKCNGAVTQALQRLLPLRPARECARVLVQPLTTQVGRLRETVLRRAAGTSTTTEQGGRRRRQPLPAACGTLQRGRDALPHRAAREPRQRLAVHIPTMPHRQSKNDQTVILELADQAVVANPVAPQTARVR